MCERERQNGREEGRAPAPKPSRYTFLSEYQMAERGIRRIFFSRESQGASAEGGDTCGAQHAHLGREGADVLLAMMPVELGRNRAYIPTEGERGRKGGREGGREKGRQGKV